MSMVINCAEIELMATFWCAVLELEPYSHGETFRVLHGRHGNVAMQMSDDPVTYRHEKDDIYSPAADRDAECARVLRSPAQSGGWVPEAKRELGANPTLGIGKQGCAK